jgi:hypothetical protein
MRFFRRTYLIPVRPFLLRYFPVFIGAIFMSILGGTAVVALLEHYYPRTAPWALSASSAEEACVVLALFTTLCNVMIGYGRPKWVWGMYGFFIACLLVALPALRFSPHPFIFAESIVWPLVGLLLLCSKRHQEFRAKAVELRHLRAKVQAAINKRRQHERAIIRIKKPR